MSEREEGWYWVKYIDHDDPIYWECVYWTGGEWDDAEVAAQPKVVGPRIPTPDEPWQTVPVKATDNMKLSAWKIWDNAGDAQHQVWRAMLAAAPTPGGGDER